MSAGLIFAVVGPQAGAQIFNPYLTGQGASGQTGAGQTSASGAGFGQTTGNGSQNGQGNAMGQSGGSQGSLVPGVSNGSNESGFTPLVIPNAPSDESTGDERNATAVLNPTAAGQTPGPLYARALATPGEFELFQRPPPALSEFERYVQDKAGEPLQRFGSTLLLQQGRGFALPATATVPPDYALNPGDQIEVDFTGSVEASLRLTIDSEGRIFIPRIGAVNVAGVHYGDLAAAIRRRVETQYKRVNVSVIVARLHGITIYVTGFATTPGSYTVSSLSTMIDAVLSAGGPSAGGSYRTIELMRGGQRVATLDLYELLFNGDKSHDPVLQNGDVLNIAPVGPELAIYGSVNNPAIYEAKPGETLAQMLRYAGGPDTLADTSRAVIRSLADLDHGGSREAPASALPQIPAQRGDLVRLLSLGRVARPQEREYVLATIEGEVDHPGRYFLPPGSHLSDLLAKGGGLTRGAFTYGTVVERESIRIQEQASFDRAIDNLKLSAAALPLQLSSLSGGANGANARSQGALDVIDRLRSQRPDGRLVLDLPVGAPLPGDLLLENNDRIFVPPTPMTVGVFGAVYKTGTFLFAPGERLEDYLRLAGGAQKIADRHDVFVVRANGSVVSMHSTHDFGRIRAIPGDVIFVPVRTSAPLIDKIIAASTLIFNTGVSAATVAALLR